MKEYLSPQAIARLKAGKKVQSIVQPDKLIMQEGDRSGVTSDDNSDNFHKSQSHLQLYRFDLITFEETRIEGCHIIEEEDFLCPHFCQSFGSCYGVYTDEGTKEFFDSLEKAQAACSKKLKDDKVSSFVVDVNSREIVCEYGESIDKESAVEDGVYIPPVVEAQTESLIEEDMDSIIDLSNIRKKTWLDELSKTEQMFFETQYFLLEKYVDQQHKETAGNPQQALDNDIKLYCFKDIEQEVFAIPTCNEGGEPTEMPVTSFLATVLVSPTPFDKKSAGFCVAPHTKPPARKSQAMDIKDKLYKRLLFIIADEKRYELYHDPEDFQPARAESPLRKQKSRRGNLMRGFFKDALDNLANAAPPRSDVKLNTYDVKEWSDDPNQNLMSLELHDVILPSSDHEHDFTQYYMYNFQTQQIVLMYPNFKSTEYAQNVRSGEDGGGVEESSHKVQSMNDYVKSLIKARIMSAAKASPKLIDFNYIGVPSNELVFREQQDLNNLMKTIFKKLEFDINQTSFRIQIMSSLFRSTLFIFDSTHDYIRIINFNNFHEYYSNVVNKHTDLLQFKELPQRVNSNFMLQQPGGSTNLCKRQRLILDTALSPEWSGEAICLNSIFINVLSCRNTIAALRNEEPCSKPEGWREKIQVQVKKADCIMIELPDFFPQKGIYSSVVISKLDSSDSDQHFKKPSSIRFLYQCRSAKHYLFCFKVNKQYVFVRKTHQQVF